MTEPSSSSGSAEAEIQVYQEALAKGNRALVDEIRLKHMAKAMAKALTQPGVGMYLKEKIGQRFDGDYDVLWKNVKDHQIPGRGHLRGLVQGRLGHVVRFMEDIEQVPYLQVALPVGFDDWDGKSPILVAYTPLTLDDTEWEYIYAYDHKGKEYRLDAWIPPDQPLMVISLNERTDLEGNVTFGRSTGSRLGRLPVYDPGDDTGGGGSGGGSSSGPSRLRDAQWGIDLYFQWTRAGNLYEAWPGGDPEFKAYFITQLGFTGPNPVSWGDAYGHWGFLGLNYYQDKHVGDPYKVNSYLWHWSQGYGEYLTVGFFEDDPPYDPSFTETHTLSVSSTQSPGTIVSQDLVIDETDDWIGMYNNLRIFDLYRYEDGNYCPPETKMYCANGMWFAFWWPNP